MQLSQPEPTMRIRFVLLFALCLLPAATLGQDPANVSTDSSSSLTDLGTRRFGQDWPTFLGPDADSKSPETGILKDWSGDSLKIVWQMPLTQSYGAPTVSRGRLFLFDSEQVERGKNVGKLSCLNSETGEKIWEYKYEYEYRDQYGYNNGPRCSPIVDGDRVYILGVDGRLTCVRANDGKELWRFDTSGQFNVVQNFFGVGSNPVVTDKLVIAMVGGSPAGSRQIGRAKGNGSGIVALDKVRGKVVWKLSDELASYSSLKLLSTHSGTGRPWCFAFARGGLLAFDPRNGKKDFHFPWRARILESVNASVPVVFENNVFISETYGPGSALLDFSQIENGKAKVVWQDEPRSREKSMQTHWNTAIYHDGYLYGSSGRHQANAELRCIRANTGEVMWTQPGLGRCSLLLVDKHFVCLAENGEVYLLKATPEKFEQVSSTILREAGRSLLKYPAWAAPVLSRGLLYLRGDDRLVCVELISSDQ